MWSGATWLVSVSAVTLSGAVAAAEGNWRRSARLQVGFATHGGMWGDAVLLPVVNALVVPWIASGWWLIVILLAAGVAASVALHAWWHGGHAHGIREHMWPERRTGQWMADLSWAGWCHLAYVACEVAVLLAYVIAPMPTDVVMVVSLILSVHVPLGVLLPAWTATRRVFREDVWQMALAIVAIWAVAGVKVLRA
jgi:hypothetical protein